MTSWSDLPFEIRLLDLILANHESQGRTQDRDSAKDLILSLANTLPFLRKDIVSYCRHLKDYSGQAAKKKRSEESDLSVLEALGNAHWILEYALMYWRSQTWREI